MESVQDDVIDGNILVAIQDLECATHSPFADHVSRDLIVLICRKKLFAKMSSQISLCSCLGCHCMYMQ
ncbi:hypothetical protein DPMN_092095 [Dreissena polymorpha]|uniref:Uncharacterized protein n=1 Tax=Dreissena polymorpha TaxID=45954 RepID=A0A9D4R0M3_DREPO|nr:hypothetical protein DPMN_092095 [Dreissena polymorpha]